MSKILFVTHGLDMWGDFSRIFLVVSTKITWNLLVVALRSSSNVRRRKNFSPNVTLNSLDIVASVSLSWSNHI